MTATELLPRLRPHVAALMTRLATATMPGGAVIPAGNHRNVMSTATPPKIVAPANVLYIRPGGSVTGSLGCPDTDVWLRFQVTSIGVNPDQTFAVADAAFGVLTASALAVEDRAIFRVKRTWFGAAVQRDETVSPPMYFVPAEYELWSTPALEEES